MTDMMPAIDMRDVVFRFWEDGKRNILDHMSLTIPAGQITVVMGASGCGKSTLAAVAAGLYPENGGYLQQGDIRLFGEPLNNLDIAARARLLSVMFQNPDLQFCMDTLRSEMIFCLENLSIPPEDMDALIDEAADRLRMTALLDHPLTTLSGGEKQKAALCCLYVMRSRCILLDEPFANIDPDAAEDILQLLIQMKQEGCTIVAIDHQPSLWLKAADEIILLTEGGHTAARGINRENISQYRDMFEQQGVFFPTDSRRGEHMPEKEAILRFEDVSIPLKGEKKRLFRKAPAPVWLLEHADAAFPRESITAILGPSGCGKTTTFLSLLQQHPFTGKMLLEGRGITAMKPRALYREIGIVFQNPANQFVTQNVLDEVMAGIRVWYPDMPENECAAKAEALLSDYGLARQKRYSPYMLSQGQQRRLAVLSVLAGQQKILLLDEPTYGQDARSTRVMMQQLREKIRREHLTVILITHDRQLAAEWADKVYCFRDRTLQEVSE
ncbi:MAG: ABC transporter ATP-binding protein [Clostridia bacterium]|nr:ABC transporter ATP-binding protein [Clostridia bacterium]